MIYQIFNPITGTHLVYQGDIDGARVFRQNLIAEGCVAHMAPPDGDEAQIQSAKDEWMAIWAKEFTSCQVTILPNGDEQWDIIDLSS